MELSNTSNILDGNPERKTQLGRPRLILEDNIKIVLKE
jgi:hypothetical protein